MTKKNIKIEDLSSGISEIDLGQEGVDFAKSKLESGGPFSSAVLKLFDESDTCFAPLPQNTELKRATEFRYGGHTGTDVSEHWLANYLKSQWGDNYSVVLEDPWMKPTDFKIIPAKEDHFFCDSVIYYAMTANDNAFQKLSETIKKTRSWLFIGFVLSPAVSLPASGKTVDKSYVDKLAESVRAVFISAYDRESFVIWQKNK